MKTKLLFALTASLVITTLVSADDLDKLAGKWTVKKTNDQGEAYTQTIELKKDKFTFKIVGSDGKTVLCAEGEVKLEKLGPFSSIKFLTSKAGQSESDLQPVEDERSIIYQLGSDSLTVASNLDKERSQKPAIDVYKKAP